MGLTLVTGGARSGKSTFAESMLKECSGEVVYVATAKVLDDEMKERIQKHRLSRPREWTTVEGYCDLHLSLPPLLETSAGMLLDCVTIMITNLMFDEPEGWDELGEEKKASMETKIIQQFQQLVQVLKSYPGQAVLVTNEVGMGLVPEYPLSRFFRDVAGRVNQYLAREADEVYFTVSGIPMKLK